MLSYFLLILYSLTRKIRNQVFFLQTRLFSQLRTFKNVQDRSLRGVRSRSWSFPSLFPTLNHLGCTRSGARLTAIIQSGSFANPIWAFSLSNLLPQSPNKQLFENPYVIYNLIAFGSRQKQATIIKSKIVGQFKQLSGVSIKVMKT